LTRTTTVEQSLPAATAASVQNVVKKEKSTSPMQRNLADRSGRYYNNLHQ
jgi:hypothetical protein